jgi:sulfite exporter TauE/SafE
VLGVAAGSLGAAVDLGGSAVGLQRAAAASAGAVMIVFGIIALLRISGARVPRAPLPAFLKDAVARGHRVAFGLSPAHRALAVGMLTTLLPCGWLYAFAVTAAGTASPAWGAVTMAVFWLGTLPVMVALGSSLQAITGALGRRMPALTSLVLVGVGLLTLSGRLHVRLPASDSAGDASITRVNSLDWTGQPCCSPTGLEGGR